ncbi:MAG: SMP-30/gluconolactonase/LRE family protein, partial [Acidobacteriota bacterium]|nr:SMP-30/gluconolactonase/LRE family protein [Acidobacteriota bacterium]
MSDNPSRRPQDPDWVAASSKLTSAAVIAFTEGPAADAEGNVFFSDIANNRIMKLSAEGVLSVFREDSGRTNGNMFDRQGRLVTCEGAEHGPRGRRRVTRTDVATGEVEVLADRCEGRRLNSPNDVTVDTQGRLYFTDPRYDPDRSDL